MINNQKTTICHDFLPSHKVREVLMGRYNYSDCPTRESRMGDNLSSLPESRNSHYQFPEVIGSVFLRISWLSTPGIAGCTADGKDGLS